MAEAEQSFVENDEQHNISPQESDEHHANEFDQQNSDGGEKKWPGWPGESVFRMLVPAQKVGNIIGCKGEFIKQMAEETKARIKVLDGPPGSQERTVLVSATEEPDASRPPAMLGLLKVHSRIVDGLDGDSSQTLPAGGKVSTKLLVPATQAESLIGKQGSTVKSIQETANCIVRVLGQEDLPVFALQDDRVVEVVGDPASTHKAIELIASHLRKFLVDRSIIPQFEKQICTGVETGNIVKSHPLLFGLHPLPQGEELSSAKRIGGCRDMVCEILWRLPAESVLKLKSVDKLWYSIISDRNFCQHHSCRSLPSFSSIILLRTRKRTSYPLLTLRVSLAPPPSELPVPHFFRHFFRQKSILFENVIACNGLLLTSLGVYNPTSNEVIPLSAPPKDKYPRADCSFNLAFDATLSPNFEVLCIFHIEEGESHDGACCIYSYSLETREWSYEVANIGTPRNVVYSRYVYYDRKIIWFSKSQYTIFFDMVERRVKLLKLPYNRGISSSKRIDYFGVSGGRVFMIGNIFPDIIRVYELDASAKEWGWLQRSLISFQRVGLFPRSILSFVWENEAEQPRVIFWTPGRIISYNVKTKESSVLAELQSDESFDALNWSNSFNFIQSLYRWDNLNSSGNNGESCRGKKLATQVDASRKDDDDDDGVMLAIQVDAVPKEDDDDRAE